MKILLLSSSSLHFPLDIQVSLKEAGLESHRLSSLNEFIASPFRKEPFLAILEVGSTEDIDRALVAYEWAETVQPLAAARYLLLVGSKHISLQEKSSRFRGVEIAQLPLPTKNLLFKVELQLKVLSSEAGKSAAGTKKLDGFSAEIRGADRDRVMVIRGMGPKEGGWKNSGEAPQGRTRWRWIDDPPKKGKPEEKFSWSAESKTAPIFNSEIDAWEVKDPEADLQCHRGGKEVFSAKKASVAAASEEGKTSSPAGAVPANTSTASQSTTAPEAPRSSSVAASATASAQNNLVNANAPGERPSSPAAPASTPATTSASNTASFSNPTLKGANPLRVEAPAEPAAAEKKAAAIPSLSSAESKSPAAKAAASASVAAPVAKERNTPEPSQPAPTAEKAAPTTELPKLGQGGMAEKTASPQVVAPSKTQAPAQPEAAPAKASAEYKPGVAKEAPSAAQIPAASPQPRVPNEPTPGSSPAPKSAASAATPSPTSAQTAPVESVKPVSSAQSPATPSVSLPTGNLGGHSRSAKGQAAPSVSAPAPAEKKETSATATAQTSSPKPSASAAPTPPVERTLRTEVINTVQERPADPGHDSQAHFPEKTREITGKIVIPTTPNNSDVQNLVRSSDARDTSERNVISSAPRAAEESPPIKSRLFLTLSLEEMQDQNSSWIPVEGYRIYLSARHRYYGLREMNDVFPLWIYEGELAPEFLDLQKSWKFYDRLPKSYSSLESLPAPVARYLVDLVGAKAQPAVPGEEKAKEAIPAGNNPNTSTSSLKKTDASSTSASAFRTEKPAAATDAASSGLFGTIKRILGMKD